MQKKHRGNVHAISKPEYSPPAHTSDAFKHAVEVMQKDGSVTIDYIAERAGVSRSTIRRYIAAQSGRADISDQTIKHIESTLLSL